MSNSADFDLATGCSFCVATEPDGSLIRITELRYDHHEKLLLEHDQRLKHLERQGVL